MSEVQPTPPDSDIDDELKQALAAAFGDEAENLLDDLDDDDEISDEMLAAMGGDIESNTSESPNEGSVEHDDENDDSPRTRWIKKLSRAIYANNRSADDSDSTRSSRVVLFAVGDQQFGLPLSGVREIARYPRVTELPRTPSWLRGVANFRGQIVSVTDMRNLLHVSSPRPAVGERVIVVHSTQNAANTAIVVDRVLGIRSLEDESEDISDLSHRIALIASGTATIEEASTVLIDPDQLFGSAELTAFTS